MRNRSLFLLTFLACSIPANYAFCDMHSCKDKSGNIYVADEAWKLPANCVNRSTLSTDRPANTENSGSGPSAPTAESGRRDRTSPEVSQRRESDTVETASSRQKLLPLLAEKKFSALNAKIREVQRSYDTDFRNEKAMTALLREFETVDPKVEALLDAWAASCPNDFQPFLCRAAYLSMRGKYARGFAFASETTGTQFQNMASLYAKASADCRKALQLNPGLVHAYAYLINMGGSTDDVDLKPLLDQALKINPYSLTVREEYLGNLAPRWGGSLEQMKAFVDEARSYVDRYPALKILEGQLYIAEGLDADGEKQYPRAIDLYTKALTYGESRIAYWRRGNAHQHMSLSKAIADYDKAIAMDPSFILAYYNRYAARGLSGDVQGAMTDLCRITELGMSAADMAREFQANELDLKRKLAKSCK